MPDFTIPPDNRAVGSGNPPQDVNQLSDMAGLLSAVVAQWGGYPGNTSIPAGNTANVTALQALLGTGQPWTVVPPPSGDATGATDTGAWTTALAGGGIVLVPDPGSAQWLVTGNIPIPDYTVIWGPAFHSSPVIKLVNSSGAHAVFASHGYLNGATSSGYPVIVRNLSIDVNGANNAGVHGIVLLVFRGWLDHCYIQNPGGAGLVYADQNSSGISIGNTAVENRLTACEVYWTAPAATTGQYGIWIQDHSTGAVTDGYMTDNIVGGSGDIAINAQRASGWWISGNHVYSAQQGGMFAGACYATSIHHNQVAIFGAASSASTTYYGYDIRLLANNQPSTNSRPSSADHNLATTDESAAGSTTTFRYFRVRNDTGSGTATLTWDHNTAHRDKTGSAVSVAWLFDPNTATLDLQGGFNVADGPSAVPVTASGTVSQAVPSRLMYKQSSAVTLGLSGSYGTAVTFGAEQASLGYIPTTVAMNWTGTYNTGSTEATTAQIVATYDDSTTQTLTFGAVSSVQAQSANDSQRFSLYKDSVYLTQLAVSAKSSLGSTAVVLTAEIAGFNAN